MMKTSLAITSILVYALLCSFLLLACHQSPPSWEQLITLKITEHYPSYSVERLPDGALHVIRPAQPDKTIDVKAISELCLRGNKDCNWMLDQMLIELR